MMQTSRHTILIAEDDPDDRELIATAFAKADPALHLEVVVDGREALDYLRQAADDDLPCMIVLDYNMPELNGAQVIRELMPDSRFRGIPKIILSTSSNPVYMQECLHQGAYAWRVKPDYFPDLVRIAGELAQICRRAA